MPVYERDIQDMLKVVCDTGFGRSEVSDILDGSPLVEARTFEEAGVLTYNSGIVAKDIEGNEYQITIVKK